MNISRYSILRPSVIIFFLVLVLLGGIYAFEELGKREDSTFVIKSAIVICPYDIANHANQQHCRSNKKQSSKNFFNTS